jgi:hypothetical protein
VALWKTDLPGIVDLPRLPGISDNDNYTADEGNHFSDMGAAAGEPTSSLKETKFSMKQFSKWMGQVSYRAINKWKNAVVTWQS